MFPGKRQAYMGIGGGSDCVQAAILAILSGNQACVGSIRRTSLTKNAISRQQLGNYIFNHGGEIGVPGSGVFRILPETTVHSDFYSSGRFYEPLIAAHIRPVYLIVDCLDGGLTEQNQIVMDDFGKPDALIAIDTGGDALYRTEQAEDVVGKTTPDQDISSLLAISKLKGIGLYSGIVAKGVDTPSYANDVLKAAEARYVTLSDEQIETVLRMYEMLELDGSNPDRYGKTPFAWQAALKGHIGQVRIPLPDHAVNHPTNPWNPIVNIDSDTAGIYVMELLKHVAVILRTLPSTGLSQPPAVELHFGI